MTNHTNVTESPHNTITYYGNLAKSPVDIGNHANLVELPHEAARYSGNLANSPLGIMTYYEFLAKLALGATSIAIKPAKPHPHAVKNYQNPAKASSPNLLGSVLRVIKQDQMAPVHPQKS